MDSAATVALAAALEMEFASLRHRIEELKHEHDEEQFEQKTNALVMALPLILAEVIHSQYAKNVLHSILATSFAEGVAHIGGAVRNTGKLMRPDHAYAALRQSHILDDAVNPLHATEDAFEVRAAAVSKILKGQIVQQVRNDLEAMDGLGIEAAQEAVTAIADDLEDLSGNAHVQAHAQAQAQLARGYGVFSATQREAYLNATPFQEFYRAEHRVAWRNWPQRWNEQGGRFYPGPSDYPEGRMIAEVNSKIWEDLSNPHNYSDGTGSPYPPFAYNSGMDVRAVSLADAKKLGLHGAHHRQRPRKIDFNAGISFSVDLHPDIQASLLDSLDDWQLKQDGELHHEEA